MELISPLLHRHGKFSRFIGFGTCNSPPVCRIFRNNWISSRLLLWHHHCGLGVLPSGRAYPERLQVPASISALGFVLIQDLISLDIRYGTKRKYATLIVDGRFQTGIFTLLTYFSIQFQR